MRYHQDIDTPTIDLWRVPVKSSYLKDIQICGSLNSEIATRVHVTDIDNVLRELKSLGNLDAEPYDSGEKEWLLVRIKSPRESVPEAFLIIFGPNGEIAERMWSGKSRTVN